MNAVVLDTAGPCVGVAGYRGAVARTWTARIQQGADGWLSPALAEAVAWADPIELVAVVEGPGAFTGLRVGLAHALGLALARGLPVATLSSLAVRARLAAGEARVLALLDARKSRVYAQLFDARADVPVPLDAPRDVAPEALEWASAVAVGEGASVYAATLASLGHRVVPDAGRLPLAEIGALLASAPRRDPAAVGPAYLRAPDARPPVALARPDR